MRRIAAIVTFGLLVSACAPTATERYRHELEAWDGRSERELYAQWGRPSQVDDRLDGSKTLVYAYQLCAGCDQAPYAKPSFSRCTTKFEVDAVGLITTSQWTGDVDACLAGGRM
jgi:hypothetical protein